MPKDDTPRPMPTSRQALLGPLAVPSPTVGEGDAPTASELILAVVNSPARRPMPSTPA